MEINRRHLLGVAGAAMFWPMPARSASFTAPAEFFYSGVKTDRGFEAIFFRSDGEIVTRYPVPVRLHGGAVKPDGSEVTIFSRRPGEQAYVFSSPNFEMTTAFACPADRRFNGHGCYSPDGQLLFTSENDFANELGVIGIYDTQKSYARVGEYESFGIGPHEIIMMSDGVRLAIANGGIATHPDFPRQKLNIPLMKSNIAYLDCRSGTLLEQIELPDSHQKLSLRHICEGSDGSLWIGGQYEGQGVFRELVGFHSKTNSIEFTGLAEDKIGDLHNYVGSVAMSADKKTLAVTCPRGNKVIGIDTQDKTIEFSIDLEDCSGAARTAKGFVFSNGSGELHSRTGKITRISRLKWDNHVTNLGNFSS